jgi:hypothetical protein
VDNTYQIWFATLELIAAECRLPFFAAASVQDYVEVLRHFCLPIRGRWLLSLRRCVAEGWDEAALATVVLHAGLGVVGEEPFGSAETGDHCGVGRLGDFAVVGGVGLTGDGENLSDADLLNNDKRWLADSVGRFDFDA